MSNDSSPFLILIPHFLPSGSAFSVLSSGFSKDHATIFFFTDFHSFLIISFLTLARLGRVNLSLSFTVFNVGFHNDLQGIPGRFYELKSLRCIC